MRLPGATSESSLDHPLPDQTDAAHRSRPLPYAPEIEHAEADEAETIDGIIAAMMEQSAIVAERQHHTHRASHAKSTGVVTGTLTVSPDLPPELAQGLFAAPGRYAVAVRFAQGPGEILPDRISTHRGMAIKVFGVAGEKLPGHGDDTQDFVLATGTVFPSGTAQQFLKDEKQILATTKAPENVSTGIKAAVSGLAQAVTSLVGGSASPKADFFGHPPTHPLSDSYYSQAPIRFGAHVAKLGAFPAAPEMQALAGKTLDVGEDSDGFRHAVAAFFRDHDVRFELRAQLWTDADSQPIEDTSVEWPEAESPYVTVATLLLPRQDAYGAERQRFFDDVLSFRPAHALAAHRPLGSVMRARLKVYQALSDFRHKANGAASTEPVRVEDIPA